MHNVSVNARRRDYRAPPLASLDRPGLEPSTRATQEDHLSIAALRDAVNSLPREQEEVILLVGLEDSATPKPPTSWACPWARSCRGCIAAANGCASC
jgi:DNA-directed RNA polymerase specialized sigma24 family protein